MDDAHDERTGANMKGCMAASNEPANVPVVELCLAAMSGIS